MYCLFVPDFNPAANSLKVAQLVTLMPELERRGVSHRACVQHSRNKTGYAQKRRRGVSFRSPDIVA